MQTVGRCVALCLLLFSSVAALPVGTTPEGFDALEGGLTVHDLQVFSPELLDYFGVARVGGFELDPHPLGVQVDNAVTWLRFSMWNEPAPPFTFSGKTPEDTRQANILLWHPAFEVPSSSPNAWVKVPYIVVEASYAADVTIGGKNYAVRAWANPPEPDESGGLALRRFFASDLCADYESCLLAWYGGNMRVSLTFEFIPDDGRPPVRVEAGQLLFDGQALGVDRFSYVEEIPEPSTMLLTGIGLFALARIAKRVRS